MRYPTRRGIPWFLSTGDPWFRDWLTCEGPMVGIKDPVKPQWRNSRYHPFAQLKTFQHGQDLHHRLFLPYCCHDGCCQPTRGSSEWMYVAVLLALSYSPHQDLLLYRWNRWCALLIGLTEPCFNYYYRNVWQFMDPTITAAGPSLSSSGCSFTRIPTASFLPLFADVYTLTPDLLAK